MYARENATGWWSLQADFKKTEGRKKKKKKETKIKEKGREIIIRVERQISTSFERQTSRCAAKESAIENAIIINS